MKQFALCILFFLTIFTGVRAQGVEWLTWEEAQKRAQEEPRKIFVDVYTYWCGWCKTMDKKTFRNRVIYKYLNENYYAIKFDAEYKKDIDFKGNKLGNSKTSTRSPHDLAVALLDGKMSYPSIVLLNENFERIQALPGYKSPEDLEPILKFIHQEKYNEVSWTEYLQSFESEL